MIKYVNHFIQIIIDVIGYDNTDTMRVKDSPIFGELHSFLITLTLQAACPVHSLVPAHTSRRT